MVWGVYAFGYDHFQSWLEFGHGLLFTLPWVQFWLIYNP